MRTIEIFDTTLRDGEQSAGCCLDGREKLKIARELDLAGVDVIEAGFPISSPRDHEAVALIAREVQRPVICGLARAMSHDIMACADALSGARRSRIHTGIGISDIHLNWKFADAKYGADIGHKKEHIRNMAVDAVRLAKDHAHEVEFYAEDAGRADVAYLCSVLEAVIAAGADVVNIPDTTGYCMAGEFSGLISTIRNNVPNIQRARISVHCHNDLGQATANSLAAVHTGADQVQCTMNGIGERAGNAALEEVVMALRVRQDYFSADTRVDSRRFHALSGLVANLMETPVASNKAIVGANAFAHSAGIHVHGILQNRQTYEIMRPEDIGVKKNKIILTARTGRHGLRHRVQNLGIQIPDEKFEDYYKRFIQLADNRREIRDEDLLGLCR